MGNSIHNNFVYNLPIEGSKTPGFSSVYRSERNMNGLVTTVDSKFTSMKDVIYNSWERNKSRDFLGKIKLTTTNDSSGKPVEHR